MNLTHNPLVAGSSQVTVRLKIKKDPHLEVLLSGEDGIRSKAVGCLGFTYDLTVNYTYYSSPLIRFDFYEKHI